MEAKLLVFLALLACATAGPLPNSDTCAQTCDTPTKFRYQPGYTYTYDYEIQSETSMSDASQEKAIVIIKGQANIEVIDQCDFVLKMKNVQVQNSQPLGALSWSDERRQLGSLLESRPLRFGFQDGLVSDLCPERDEDPAALNIKRGLLSALQNSMDNLKGSQNLRESDVTGTCDTKYEVVKDSIWGQRQIKRSKDLSSCTDRHSYAGSLQSVKYQLPSEMETVPLMSGQHDCEQIIDRSNLIASSKCQERHIFRPFSAQNSGALTSVSQKLSLTNTAQGITSRKGVIQSRGALTFDHGFDMKDSSEARQRAESMLATLCDITKTGVQPEVPRIFSQLVEAVKKMDRGDIREVYQQLQRGQICSSNAERTKKFFLDALPMSSSSEAVSVMVDLMVSADVSGLEVDFWITSLAFIPQPTEDMLESVKVLVKSDSLRLRSMLAVTSMVNNLCTKTNKCDVSSVLDIIQALDSVIGNKCTVNDGNIKTVLTTLSAIGNTGNSRGADILERCLYDRLPTEVRVAAAQAYRRMPCDTDKSQLQSILDNKKEDSEIRIAAYLPLMTCPTSDLLTRIQMVLEAENEESQVGSFIYSHLQNLKETSSPLKQSIRDMVRNVQLTKAFESNPLKASRNYEKSAFLTALKLGGQAESNVIFSSRSPLPRSVSANLTVEVLGHSLNLLELGGRLEGLEYLIEIVQSHIFSDAKPKSKSKLDELKGSGYARIFGNELAFGRFQGINSLTSGSPFNLLDFLIKLSEEHDYSFTQSLQLFDVSMTVPTISGLPLTLSVNGTAVVDVQAQGKLDLRKVSQSPRSVFIDGQIKPSGAVNVDAIMSVDALVTGTGLKMASSLFTSMALKGRIELDKGRVLSVEIDMPDDKTDIIDVNTKFFIVHNDQASEQLMITDNRQKLELCTGSFGAKLSGLELCGQLQFPNASMQSVGPYFPLTGPSSLSLVLHKRDSHTGYKLLAKRAENKRSSIAQLLFDTPGSSVERAVSFGMDINYEQHQVDLALASPWWKSSVKGAFMNEDRLKSLTAEIGINDNQYSLTSELKIDDQDEGQVMVLTPLLEIRVPDREIISLTGSVRLDKNGNEYTTDLALSGVSAQPIQLKSSLTNTKTDKRVIGALTFSDKTYRSEAGVKYNIRPGKSANFNPLVVVSTPSGDLLKLEGEVDFRNDKMLRTDLTLTAPKLLAIPFNVKSNLVKKAGKDNRYKVDVRVKSRPFSGKVNGFLKLGDTTSTKLIVEYNVNRRASDVITVNGKLSDKSTPAFIKYTVTGDLDFKNNPDYNVKLDTLDFEHKVKHTAGTLNLAIGKNPKSKNSQIFLSGTVSHKFKDVTEVECDYKGKAVVPMIGLDSSLEGSHAHFPDSLVSKVNLEYAKEKAVKVEVNLKNKKEEGKLRMTGDASLSFPGYSYDLSTALRQSGKQYTHTILMKCQNGALLDVKSSYKPVKDDTHEVTSEIQLGEFKPIKISGTAGLELSNLQLQGQLLHGDDSYSLNALSKLSKGPRGKWTVEYVQPSRTVAFNAMGGIQGSSVDLDLDIAWNKDRDDKAKIVYSMSGSHKSSFDVQSTVAKADMTTPFSALSKLSAGLSVDSDKQRYGLDGKFSLNDDSYTSKFETRKPLSLSNVQMDFSVETPLQGMKRVAVKVDHTLTPRSLRSVINAERDRKQTALSILFNDNSKGRNTDVSGDVTIKSDDMDSLRDVTLSVAHKDDGRKYDSRFSVGRDGQRYGVEMDMTHYMSGWSLQNVGQVKVISPDQTVITTWQHRNSENDIKSVLKTDLGKGKLLQVEISGDKKIDYASTSVNGALAIRSPWELPKDLSLTLKHDLRQGRLTHSSAININGRKVSGADVNYLHSSGDLSGDFSLSLPIIQNTSGKVKALYGRYPISGNVEWMTSPGNTYSADASLQTTGPMNLEGSLRMTTPLRDYPAFVVTGTVKQEGNDVISKAILDLGVRNVYDVEVRLRPTNFTLARVKINTPLRGMTSLDTGYLVSGDFDDFEISGDISLEPSLGKYSGLATYRYDGNGMYTKLRVDTPIRNLRYAQLTLNSQLDDAGRKSTLEAQYYPRETFTLTNVYTTTMPLIFSLQSQTPFRGYESFELSLKHQQDGRGALLSYGQLQYLPGKVIEGTLSVKSQPKLDAFLMVKTPFKDFQESRLSLRHDGDVSDFNTNAELKLLRQKMTADVSFKTGFASNGKITISTSVASIPKLEAAFSKRGSSDNIEGQAYLSYGDSKIEGGIKHKLADDLLQSSASFKTPYTLDFDAAVFAQARSSFYRYDVSAQYGEDYRVQSAANLTLTDPDITFISDLNYNLDGSKNVITASFNKKGALDDFNVQAHVTSNPDSSKVLEVTGKLKMADGLDANLEVDLPFLNYDDMTFTVSHKPKVRGFTQKGSATYKRDKTVAYSLDMENDGMSSIEVEAELTSPFPYLEQTSLKVNHKSSNIRQDCTGSAEIQCYLGSHKLAYNRQGDWNHLTVDASLESNGNKVSSHAVRLPLSNGYRHSLDFTIPSGKKYSSALETEQSADSVRGKLQTDFSRQLQLSVEADASIVGDVMQLNAKGSVEDSGKTNSGSLSAKKTGPLNDITLELKGGINAKEVSGVAQFKRLSGKVSGSVSVKTPFTDYKNIGASFQHSGELDRFNSEASLKYRDDNEMSGKVNFYSYQWERLEASGELITPFKALKQLKTTYRHASTSEKFTCDLDVNYNNDDKNAFTANIRGSVSPKYDASVLIKTPFSKFSRLQAEGSLESIDGAKALTTSLDFSSLGRFSLDANMDSQAVPATVSLDMTTPFSALPHLQLTAAHQGTPEDFSSEFSFTTPQTDTIKGDAIFKYRSVFDVSGSASLKTRFSGFEDLSAEVKNTDVGGTKSGHALARWAPGQQMTVDGTYSSKDFWSSKQYLADVAMATPFDLVRSANLHVQHEQIEDQYKPKATATLNGEIMLDFEGELRKGNNPFASVTSRKPWPAQVSASLTESGDLVEGELFFNWNSDKSDQNIRLKAKAKDVQDNSQINKDYSIKVIHPLRSVGAGVALFKTQTKVTSDGFVSWDDASSSKVSYALDLSDNSQYYRTVYDGSLKVSMPSRTLQSSGSFSDSRGTSAVDGSLAWDADRDTSKQVGFNAKVTKGDTTKADLTFRLPAIGKEVHIDHEMAMTQGRTLWDGKTALSYSKDPRKTLTVASSINDVSSYATGQNYSLSLVITHPITDTDISFTSHLGTTGDRYSAALDAVYMTSRRQRKNMALRGEIDKLRKQIDLQLDSPLKKMSMRGQIESSKPYVIKLTNTYDDSDVIMSKLAIDSDKQNLVFTTNYDLNNPDSQLVLQAGYLNSSFLQAKLFRQQMNGLALSTDTMLALHLVEPNLLKASIAWKPDIVDEMQTYAREKTLSYAGSLRKSVYDAASATGQEISDKYTSFAKEFTGELSPLLDLIQGELDRLAVEVDRSYRSLYNMYTSNDFYLGDMGTVVINMVKKIKAYNDVYQKRYNSIISGIREQLKDISDYDVRQKYEHALAIIADKVAMGLARNADWLNQALTLLNQQLDVLQAQAGQTWQDFQNHPQVQQYTQRAQMLGDDFKWLMSHMNERVQQFSLPQQYTSAIYNARDVISDGFSDAMDSPQVKKMQIAANEVYQQGKWAYKYWQVEENAREALVKLAELLAELVMVEFKELSDQINIFRKTNVTMYDPENGKLELNIALPFALKSLQEVPDVKAYLQSAQNIMDQYLPDKEFVVGVYRQYYPSLNSNKTTKTDNNVLSELQDFQPIIPKPLRGKGSYESNPRYKVRGA